MSDSEFETYLDLLSRFLKLRPGQRDEIRRELRAHLEEALEDELARGRSREEVLREVLDDFGDAAELAGRFSALRRKRRWIMQGTTAIACVALVVFSLPLFSSDTEVVTAAQSGAERRAAPDTGEEEVAAEEPGEDDLVGAMNAHIQEALDKPPLPGVRFEEQPLEQVCEFLADIGEFNLHVQWKVLEDYGVFRDQPVTVEVEHLPMKRILRLVLDDCVSGGVLTYAIQDGVLVISSREAFRTHPITRLYDVRDLLDDLAAGDAPNIAAPPAGSGGFGGPPGGMGGLPPGGRVPGAARPRAATGKRSVADARNMLTSLLEVAVAPDTWASAGGSGRLLIVNDILVIRQYESVHAEIEEFLDAFGDMLAEQDESAAR